MRIAKCIGPLLLAALAGCAGVEKTAAPLPQLTPPPPTPPAPVSTISAVLAIPLGDLARVVNDKAPLRFADLKDQKLKCAIGDCRATLSATRTGPISISDKNGTLALGVPFALSANVALPPPLSMVNAGVNASGQLTATTAISLGPDWSVRPGTAGSVQFQNGRVKLGPLDTDFSTIWNANAELLSRPLLGAIEAQMGPALAPQKQVAKLWAGLYAPIKINATPPLWLMLQPERIRVGMPAVAGNALTMGLGIDVRTRVVAADSVPAIPPAVLPPPAALNGPTNHFALAVPAVLTYGEAADLALKALQKNPPKAGSHTLKITKISILPSGQDVVIATEFCISENWDPTDVLTGCGSGYLRGVPQYDAKADTIRIGNVRYDVLTQNWMLSVMRGLAGDDLGKQMEKALQFKVGDQIGKLKSQVSGALSKPQDGAISITGTVQAYGPISLTWSKDGFIAMFTAEGALKAEMRL